MTVISYPIPIYQNATIHSEYYAPDHFEISAITLGFTTTITTTVDHNFVVGQEVKTLIPDNFGTRKLNQKKSFVTSVPATDQVTINISSIGMDAFVLSNDTTRPQIISVGDLNSGTSNTNTLTLGTTIPGSFKNIS